MICLDFKEYQDSARRTQNPEVTGDMMLINAALGIAGEAGEAADIVKKRLFQGHDLDSTKLISELGDILWYISMACDYLCMDLEEVAQYNVAKLRQRYPEKFSANQSVNRVEEKVSLVE